MDNPTEKEPTLLEVVYQDGPELYQQVQELIEARAEVSARAEYGESPLRIAYRNVRVEVVALLLDAGADETQLGWSDLHKAVFFDSLEVLRRILASSSDLESSDYWHRTPLALAVRCGFLEKAKLLVGAGAKEHDYSRGKLLVSHAVMSRSVEMLEWLHSRGHSLDAVDSSEADDTFGGTPLLNAACSNDAAMVKVLLSLGADWRCENRHGDRALTLTTSREVLSHLVEAGDSFGDLSDEARATLLGISTDEDPRVEKALYLRAKHPRFGTANPEITPEPFWLEMIRTGVSGWRAATAIEGDRNYEDPPIWSYQRFGRTTTLLPDGRVVEVAGEHEDHYDPDFHIYNDVTVFSTSGEITHYSYPKEVFPPTDFHTATLVDSSLYLIGCLGYPDERSPGVTPVYRLDTETFVITRIDTSGECPGWIYKHSARLAHEGDSIRVTRGEIEISDRPSRVNHDTWELRLADYSWHCVERKNDQQFLIWREDEKYLSLSEMRHALSYKTIPGLESLYEDSRQSLIERLGAEPDFSLLGALYGNACGELSCDDEVSFELGEAIVTCHEDRFWIRVTVIGSLEEHETTSFLEKLREALGEIEGVPCVVEAL